MKTTKFDLVVTRHPNLHALLVERGLVDQSTPILTHVQKARQVKGLHIVGVLPHHLSCEAASITEIPIRHTESSRAAMAAGGIPLGELREIAGEAVAYSVARVDDPTAPSLALAAASGYCEGYHGVISDLDPTAYKLRETWRGLRVMYFGSMCEQFSAAVVLSRGIWRPLQGKAGWLDGLGREVDTTEIEGSSNWLWCVDGVDRFELAEFASGLLYSSKREAWSAAESILHGHPSADGPHGVAELVTVRPNRDLSWFGKSNTALG